MESKKVVVELFEKTEKTGIGKNEINDRFRNELKCETCLFSEHCDGWEYTPFCMAEL